MKRILFLDDDRRRIAEFRAWMAGHECDLTIVETADECMEQLGRNTYDVVLLDHDLGGEIFCDSSREDCGMEVVRWIKEHGGEHGGFIVHTHNPVAGAAMYLELKNLGYNVAQATFGSIGFYGSLKKMLGGEVEIEVPTRTLRDRLTEYFRSLRLGR